MSGDVQPRRRKDKKKKRGDEGVSSGEDIPPPPPEPQWSGAAGGEWMHAQSDHGTGGHWCAKIVFFLLLAVLVTLISLIILENRGLQDIEEREVTESRYAAVFDGWLEDEPHDDHHDPHTLELTHPEEEEDNHDEHPSDLDDEVEEIEKEDDSVEHDDDEDNTDKDDDHDDDDDDDDTDNDIEDTDNDKDNNDADENSIEDDDDDIEEIVDDQSDNNDDDNDNDKDDDDGYNSDHQERDDDDDTDNDEHGNKAVDDDDDDDNSKEDDHISVERRIKVDYVRYDKPLEEVDDDEIEEVVDNHAAEEEHLARVSAEQEDDLETSNMGLKFGVGVALVVVAHWVLVRKWRNDRNNEAVDGSNNSHRRLTLVEDGEEPENPLSAIRKTVTSETRSSKPVVSFAPQNVFLEEEDSQNDDNAEDLSEEETFTTKVLPNVLSSAQCQPQVKNKIMDVEVDDEKEISEEEPEEDEEEVEIVEKINIKDSKVPDRELLSEDEDVEEADDADDYEHVDEEENLDEEQAVEEEEISDVDDEELMKKLEQKYGKLNPESK